MRTRIATPKPSRTTTRRLGEVRPGVGQGGTVRQRAAAALESAPRESVPQESTFRRVAVFVPMDGGEPLGAI